MAYDIDYTAYLTLCLYKSKRNGQQTRPTLAIFLANDSFIIKKTKRNTIAYINTTQ